jgi:hypothetical protein
LGFAPIPTRGKSMNKKNLQENILWKSGKELIRPAGPAAKGTRLGKRSLFIDMHTISRLLYI